MKLKALKAGDIAVIRGFDSAFAVNPTYRQKMLAMGLTPNTVFQVVRRAPLGDPIQIRIRQFELSVRSNEVDYLLIERLEST